MKYKKDICNRFYFYWQQQHNAFITEGEEAVRELTLVSSASSSESLRTMDWADVTCSGCTAATACDSLSFSVTSRGVITTQCIKYTHVVSLEQHACGS